MIPTCPSKIYEQWLYIYMSEWKRWMFCVYIRVKEMNVLCIYQSERGVLRHILSPRHVLSHVVTNRAERFTRRTFCHPFASNAQSVSLPSMCVRTCWVTFCFYIPWNWNSVLLWADHNAVALKAVLKYDYTETEWLCSLIVCYVFVSCRYIWWNGMVWWGWR